jgi:GT2 family glycosyltransferase
MTTRLIAGSLAPPDGAYDVDIIILALERAEETLAAIASARAQTGISAHIFVLDQGSCSNTLALLARVIRDCRDVTLLATDRNLGVAGGRNVLSELGHARVIVALDNDAEFATNNTVACMVAALDAESGLGAIGCRIVIHGSGQDDLSSWGYPTDLLPRAADSFDTVTYVGAGHAILRQVWNQAGGYDPKLFFCWEEFDFCLRAIALGWRIRYRGDIVIRHKVSVQQRVEWTATRWFYFVRNRIYIERKLGSAWWTLVPRIAGYSLKGLRNNLAVQTFRAIHAATVMTPRTAQPMPAAGLLYLSRNDRLHRGSLWHRLTREVFSRIGGTAVVAAPAKR